MPRAYVMFVDNDMLVEVKGLQDSSDDTFLNAATVTAVLLDETGTQVTGGSPQPISLGYVGGSNGVYQGIFDSVVALTNGDCGTIEITAVEGTLDAFWTLSYRVKSRVS